MSVDPQAIRTLMENAWRPEGFCVPHASIYPFQWLWDSCFHALVWAELGDQRALQELRSALAWQDPDTGFVPHLTYWGQPEHHASFWGRSRTSAITQPPMYGHTIARLGDLGFEVGADTVDRAQAGLANLLGRRPTADALVPVFHPWETGCDDSARWDSWKTGDWKERKGQLVESLFVDASGFAVGSSEFSVASCGFNALVAWNIAELDRVGGATPELVQGARELVAALSKQWDPSLKTWVDDSPSGHVRTADAMLCLLVDPRPEAIAELANADGFAGPFGIRGAHLAEPTYDPDTYWRGPSWPQLDYLLVVALNQAGAGPEAAALATSSIRGAVASGWSEYWNAETGSGGGAQPQTWTALALVLDRLELI